jgi:hypothetical protein
VVEDVIAIILIAVTAAEDAIRTSDARSETFFAKLLVNCLELWVG